MVFLKRKDQMMVARKKQRYGQTVATRVKAKRQSLAMTQDDLSDQSGLRQGTISRIEGGGSINLQSQTLVALAGALKTSVDYLLGLEDEETEHAARIGG
jgi:transcriptional regulator with XRE-family HTH domain